MSWPEFYNIGIGGDDPVAIFLDYLVPAAWIVLLSITLHIRIRTRHAVEAAKRRWDELEKCRQKFPDRWPTPVVPPRPPTHRIRWLKRKPK